MSWKGCVRWGTLAAGVTLATAQGGEPTALAWKAAEQARERFEARAAAEHTRASFAEVMDGYRAIYHEHPADGYAPPAVNAVAELLAEEGEQLGETRRLGDAAGQWIFLARNYPGSSLAAPGLGRALRLLESGPGADRERAAEVRATLSRDYPRSQAAHGLVAGNASVGAEEHRVPAGTKAKVPEAAETHAAVRDADQRVPERTSSAELVDDQRAMPGAAPAVVTGIRHWSTANYTRVAIDLGGEVQFKAARVEHPDRIFFDLHGATLAKGLVGKTFSITDDGFLKSIRAGQFGADVTRIVLDVQPVAEYSAFLLPNPTRLIIDVHGHATESEAKQVSVAPAAGRPVLAAGPVEGASERSGVSAPPESVEEDKPAPAERIPAGRAHRGDEEVASRAGASSALPPMPVTDGSAGFGLPARHPDSANATVARPRVVVSSHPTATRPVPNAVASASPESSREVAAVSEQPGVIAASAQPSSKPVVDRSPTAATHDSSDDHYHPPSHRKPVPLDETPDGAIVGAPVNPAPPTAAGQSTLMRALGLKIGRIVIDAGHGGHDSGTLGVGGIEEKNVVLDVALRLGKLLHDRLGAEVVYTRADDTFIPLETRTAIANKAQADLFISVHANSSPDPEARGVEVYYLNFTSDPEAMRVASRENAVSSQRVNQLSDLVKKIALKDKIDESRELAADVDQSLYSGLKHGNGGLKDRGVKKAPFVVLIGANMPSILAEISFVTNPDDAAELNRPEYRERVAESLFKGVAAYAGGINGMESKGRHLERAAR